MFVCLIMYSFQQEGKPKCSAEYNSKDFVLIHLIFISTLRGFYAKERLIICLKKKKKSDF